jgi:hypothetical protein
MTTNLNFLDDGQSVVSLISQLHDYFVNTHSSYLVKRGELISRLEQSTDRKEALQQELLQVDELLTLFGVLQDTLSVADRVVHSRAVATALGTNSELFQIHLEDEAEQQAERQAAQQKVALKQSSGSQA